MQYLVVGTHSGSSQETICSARDFEVGWTGCKTSALTPILPLQHIVLAFISVYTHQNRKYQCQVATRENGKEDGIGHKEWKCGG